MTHDPQTQQAIQELVIRAATQFADGKSKNEVVSLLEQDGCPSDVAQAIASKGEEIKQAEFRKGGQTTMLFGAGLAGLGLAITAGTYSAAASSGGGSYIVTTGLLIGGVWIFLKGLWRTMAG